MTNKEAIEILTQTQIYLARRNGKKAFNEALLKAIAALNERPQGEWINNECSLCGRYENYPENFCATCGADMRQEEG